jgi:hypothetical protein
MPSILDTGSEHIASMLDGNSEAMRELFSARLSGWGKPYAHENFITVGLFSDIEQEIESHVAFALIDPAIDIALAQGDRSAFVCGVALLQSLASATHTTEVPSPLRAAYWSLVERAQVLDSAEASTQLAELSRIYRNAL